MRQRPGAQESVPRTADGSRTEESPAGQGGKEKKNKRTQAAIRKWNASVVAQRVRLEIDSQIDNRPSDRQPEGQTQDGSVV